jgi:hypothetical protein
MFSIGKEEEVTKFIPFIISIGPMPALPMSMVLIVIFGSPFEVALGAPLIKK